MRREGKHARGRRPCSIARGGTLLMEEIGDLPLEVQAKLIP